MGDISKDLLVLLTQLLPGFVAAWVIYGLTSYPKPAQFERVVQALIYSLLIKALVLVEEKALTFLGRYFVLGVWDQHTELLASAISAILFGLLFSYFANNDKFYAFARNRGVTKRTAYPSEWYGAFSEYPRYIALHIDGGRRIIGYPLQWPSEPNVGHFKLVDAAWLNDDDSETELDGDHSVLIPAKEVGLVEFLKYVEELKNGTEAAKPISA
jgi:hypothetical protein